MLPNMAMVVANDTISAALAMSVASTINEHGYARWRCGSISTHDTSVTLQDNASRSVRGYVRCALRSELFECRLDPIRTEHLARISSRIDALPIGYLCCNFQRAPPRYPLRTVNP